MTKVSRLVGGAIKVEGLEDSEKKLVALANANVGAFNRGILKAGLFLQAKSQKMVPVDTGALKASAYTRLNNAPIVVTGSGTIEPSSFAAKIWGGITGAYNRVFGKKGKQPAGQTRMTFEVGYTQNYAVFVHENLTAKHPVGQAKYLEEPARMHRSEMLKLVEEEVKAAK